MSTVDQIGTEIENASQVTVRTCDLVCGRECGFDIRCLDGTVVVPGGTLLTEALVGELDARGIGTVKVDYRDVRRVICRDAEIGAADNAHGPARECLVRHGVVPYNAEQERRLAAAFQEAAVQLDALRARVLDGQTVPCKEFDTLVESHFEEMTDDVDCTLACVLETRLDDTLIGHALQLSVLGMAIGTEAALEYREIHILGLAGLMHDWGMMKVPAEFRQLERQPDAQELEAIRRHPIHTLEMLACVESLPDSVPTVSLQLHECLDGSGYPHGLRGADVHPLARILHVADTFLAQTEGLFGNSPMKPYASVESLLQMAGAGLVDRDVIRSLLRVVSLFPVGSRVELSDRRVARVIRPNQTYYTEPIVLILPERPDENAQPEVVDLTESELRIVKTLPRQ